MHEGFIGVFDETLKEEDYDDVGDSSEEVFGDQYDVSRLIHTTIFSEEYEVDAYVEGVV